jgi:RNA polymerase sigma-70 factor (ECF subfamily)
MDADDADLVRRIAAGDRRAMRLFYEKYQQAVFAFARGRCGNAELASDCVHDAMLDVWRSAGRYSGGSSVKTWLFAIARNKLVDILRKRGRLSFVAEVEDGPDTAPNPEAAAVAASDSARLHRCLDGLSDPHRTAIRLAFLEDMTYPEIAEIEDAPVGTIKTRIHHAKRALMRCLEAGLKR